MEKADQLLVASLPVDGRLTVRFLGHVDYTDPWMHFTRKQEEYILYVVESGVLYMEEEGVRYALRKNDWLLLEPGKQHSGYRPSVCRYAYVHFYADPLTVTEQPAAVLEEQAAAWVAENACSSDYEVAPCDTRPLVFLKNGHLRSGETVFHCLSRMDEAFFSRRAGRRIFCAAGLRSVFVLLARAMAEDCLPSGNAGLLADEIKSYLLTHYAEDCSLALLSERFHLHPDALNRLFRKATGKSLHQTLLEIRIDRACQLLLVTDQKIEAISSAVGFTDPLYFSRCFRKRTSLAPSHYRRAGSEHFFERGE